MYPILYLKECKTPIQAFFDVDGAYLILTHENQLTLMEDRCAHLNIPLSEGWVEDGVLVCPWHQWKYDRSGQCIFPKAAREKCIHAENLLVENDIIWKRSQFSVAYWSSDIIECSYLDVQFPAVADVLWRVTGMGSKSRIWCGANSQDLAQEQLNLLCITRST